MRAFGLVSAGITIGIFWWTRSISFDPPPLTLSASFFRLFSTLDQSGALGLLLVMVGAIFIARPSWLQRVALWLSDHLNAIALLTAVTLCAGTVFVYENHPLSMDEYARSEE